MDADFTNQRMTSVEVGQGAIVCSEATIIGDVTIGHFSGCNYVIVDFVLFLLHLLVVVVVLIGMDLVVMDHCTGGPLVDNYIST